MQHVMHASESKMDRRYSDVRNMKSLRLNVNHIVYGVAYDDCIGYYR
jgi:hypothetical protein